MIRELLQISDTFCRDHLALFYQRFEEKNQQLATLVEGGKDQGSLRSFVLQKRNKALFEQFEAAYLQSIQITFGQFSNMLARREAGEPTAGTIDRVIESELALPNMVQSAERREEFALQALNHRLSVICQSKVTLQCNPFSPQSYAYAFEQVILSLNWNLQTRILGFRLFDAELLRHLGSMYSSMNEHLASQGILPNLKPEELGCGSKRKALSTAQQSAARQHDQSLAAVTPPYKPSTLSDNPTGQFADLSETPAANEPLDATHIRAIEHIGQMFNDLLSSDSVNGQLKSLLSRLYTPYVRLALADATLAHNSNHPAQRLLQSLNRAIALHCSPEATLQRPAILLQIKSVIEQLSGEKELAPRVFSELAFRFSAELRHYDRLINARLDKKKRSLSGMRQLDGLRLSIRNIIATQLEQAEHPVPDFVSQFLFNTWVSYVTSLCARPEGSSQETDNALAMVEQIIRYSNGEKDCAQEFTQLAPQIRQGFLTCGGESLEIRQFLQRLMHHHKHPQSNNLKSGYRMPSMEAKTG